MTRCVDPRRKHPEAHGNPGAVVWSEAWDDLGPLFSRIFAGDPVHMNDISLMLDRNGRPEESHFSFSYTPVRGDGAVAGLFGICIETYWLSAEAESTERLRRDLN